MSGGVIDIAAAASAFRASLTVPEAGSGPGLVVFRDVSDQDRDLREVSDLYAAEGYVVLCPETLAVANEAEAVTAAVETLRSRSECTGKVGALGFGPGGKLAYLAAVEARVDCAVSYYGFDIEFALNFAPRIGCPLVLHFAEKDPRIPPSAVAQIK